ncbi:hypothetical protein GH714_032043 [Hevea brasiliensis]|uniref:Uncharacterized protein n=1 Tax=Hevea brasiliensis TaxID=3981 RepID=A0A6A6ND19_HEVBR|nr:hypothetical protein GH714_032043 [Hevea brasiliensis]
MADGKLTLPDDLISSKFPDEHTSNAKDEAWGGGIGEDKPLMSLLDESKEMRAPNSLSQGNCPDNNLKDSWRLDGQDKKDGGKFQLM